MKKFIFLLTIIFMVYCQSAFSATIHLKDGMKLTVSNVWEEDGKVKYEMFGKVYSYDKKDVLRIDGDKPIKSPKKVSNKVIRAKEKHGRYYLAFDAVKKNEGASVEVNIKTNIPGKIEVATGVSLAGQKPDDKYIGTRGLGKVLVKNGKGRSVLDISELAAGDYEVEVTLYPRWGFKDTASKSAGIKKEIEVKAPIELRGTEKSRKKQEKIKRAISSARDLYYELMSFKDEEDFKKNGFSNNNKNKKYATWKEIADRFTHGPAAKLLLKEGIVIGDINTLGLKYAFSRGRETQTTRTLRNEIERSLGIK